VRRASIIIVSSVAMLAVAACGNDTPTQPQAEAQACDAIASVQQALAGVGDLNADSTVEEAQQAKSALDEAIQGLQDAASDLKVADQAALQAGGQAISSAIEGVSGSETIGAAGAAVASASDTLTTAVGQISDGLGCS
jgi:hypothetical protein